MTSARLDFWHRARFFFAFDLPSARDCVRGVISNLHGRRYAWQRIIKRERLQRNTRGWCVIYRPGAIDDMSPFRLRKRVGRKYGDKQDQKKKSNGALGQHPPGIAVLAPQEQGIYKGSL
jgi:hypothetical protein